METENNMKNEKLEEIGEFVAEYADFEKSLKSVVGQIPEEQLVTLYAIFRKDARTDRVNGNGYKSELDPPATEKQKAAIKGLVNRKGMDPSISVDKMTKKEASKILSAVYSNKFRSRDRDSAYL